MSSFFTKPASQKKRSRDHTDLKTPRKRPRNDGDTNGPSQRPSNTSQSQTKDDERPKRRRGRDESISGSDSESVTYHSALEEHEESSASEDETAAERRLRLAERYLQNLQDEVQETIGFDAAEIDKDLIAERLKEDAAETKGILYKHIADGLDWHNASHTFFKADQNQVTGVATCEPYMYVVAGDMTIIKSEITQPSSEGAEDEEGTKRSSNITPRKKPKFLKRYKGYRQAPRGYLGPTSPILCVACSDSGKYLATGCENSDLIIWDAESLKPVHKFTQHRDAVLSVSFRRNSHQLFSASKDRSIKVWMIDERAYVETLFGHQDEIPAVVGMLGERCISVGARDRTARLWKVVEESQLVFRGGGSGMTGTKSKENGIENHKLRFDEGSIDAIALVDEENFVTGSDSGSLSLWNVHRKKPVFTIPLAHGLDPPPTLDESRGERQTSRTDPVSPPKPRWITALTSVPYSDVLISGSWDGFVRAWRISADKRKIEAIGIIGHTEPQIDDAADNNGSEIKKTARGSVNSLDCFERGKRNNQGLCIVAAVSKGHRLGRWVNLPGKNGVVIFEVKKDFAKANGSIPTNIETRT